MQNLNWNDFRFLLALHRRGTLTAAAQELGVSQTTVTRRLRALEEAAGGELYEKLKGGGVFTRLGAEMIATAERLETEVLDLAARRVGGDAHIEGSVRMTMTSVHAVELVEECRDFARAFPRIELEVVASDEIRKLSRREADIALRVGPRSALEEHLVGRKVADCAMAIYGAPEWEEVAWEERPWLGWVESHPGWPEVVDAYRDRCGHGSWALKANSLFSLVEAARAGAGVTVLSCGCPRVNRGLVALTEPDVFGEMWLLTHPALLGSPRVRATLDFWYDALKSRGPAFAGTDERRGGA